MNKSILTNLISLFLIVISFFFPEPFDKLILYTGLFAISGSITNELAIFMIFKRVPYLYGSGIIEKNFESFKIAIKNMIMTQFFNKEKLDTFFENELSEIDFKPIVKKADFSKIVESIFEEIRDTSLGGAFCYIGGDNLLDTIKKPLRKKIKKTVISIVESDTFKAQVNKYIEEASFSDDLIDKVDILVEDRLNDLSPEMIRDLVSKLIKDHLSWLVVWGGVFGGLIGFISTLFLI